MPVSAQTVGISAFFSRSRVLSCQTVRAVQYSNGQETQLRAIIATAPSRLDLVADMNIDITIGAPSLQIKSIRDIAAFNCVRSYGVSPLSDSMVVANTGTQSRSIEMRLARRESLSMTPRAKIIRKIVSLNPPTDSGRGRSTEALGSGGEAVSLRPSCVMTITQQKQASMTTMRFTVMVVRSVLRRDGA